MTATTIPTLVTQSGSASPKPSFAGYIQRLIAMEESSNKRLMDSLVQETSIPHNPSRSLGPAPAERVERGGNEHTLLAKL